uniref:Slc24a-7 n=1 Tax=Schmidtea mediterranea TaxID=79327 RepID=A0A0H3YFD7_SCHMD|nr:slc24a-7 [Schmidtea mediterranea]
MAACTPLKFSSFNYSNACDYITNFKGCSPNSGLINYYQWQYCAFGNRWAPGILMFLWFLFLLTGITTSADSFLAPCLVVVAKTMRMSENLAGVTLLALGNGAADVFSSLSAVTSNSNPNVGLAFGAILGAGVFVNAITAGIIMILSPFKIMKRPILKDLLFYFVALIWCMIIFIKKQIELWSSLVFLAIYVIYILVTVISRLLYVRNEKSNKTIIQTNNISITITTPATNVENAEIQQQNIEDPLSILDFISINRDERSKGNRNLAANSIGITIAVPNDKVDQENDLNRPMKKSSTISDFRSIHIGRSDTNQTSFPRFSHLKSHIAGSLRTNNVYSYDNPNYISDNSIDRVYIASTNRSNFENNFHSINDNPNSLKELYADKSDHLNVPGNIYQKKPNLIKSQNSCPNDSECHSHKRILSGYLNPLQLERFYNTLPSERPSTEVNHLKYSCSIKQKNLSPRSSIERSASHRSIRSMAKIIIDNEHEKERMENHPTAKKANLIKSLSLTVLNEYALKSNIRYWSMREIQKAKSDITNEWDILEGNYKVHPENENENKFNIETGENGDSVVTFPGPWKHFALTILPVDLEEWREQSGFSKFLSIIQSPFMFILTLTIPIVDETAYLKGWCKILNCIHCLLSLVFWVLLPNVYNTPFGTSNFLLVYLFIILGFIVGVVVAFTSKVDKPPIYQPFFAFIGLITSILWIYEIANEIVNILSVFGVVFNISSVILGLSVLAFANSTGDLVSNVTLAKNNYPRIGYSACVGGPLFNLLVGIGIPFSIRTFSGPIPVQLTGTSIVLIFTIMLVTALNLLCLPLMKFQPKRFYGIILITIYVIYFVLVILFAVDIIKVTL